MVCIESTQNIEHLTLLALGIDPVGEAICLGQKFSRLGSVQVFDRLVVFNRASALCLVGGQVSHEVSMKLADQLALALMVLSKSEQRVFCQHCFQVSQDLA